MRLNNSFLGSVQLLPL